MPMYALFSSNRNPLGGTNQPRLHKDIPSSSLPPGRVHITESVYQEVKDDFETEDGLGYTRDSYLKEKNIKSYLIVRHEPPQGSKQLLVEEKPSHINNNNEEGGGEIGEPHAFSLV